VLNYGRLVNRVRTRDAQFQQAAFAYQEKVLEAGREAEDGIIRFLKSHQRAKHLDASAQAAQVVREITFEQYEEGKADFVAVYVAESEVATVQDLAAAARGEIAQSLIDLYRALGGGWEMRLLPQVGFEGAAVEPLPLPAEPEENPDAP
jgi:outer membrane protein TolC